MIRVGVCYGGNSPEYEVSLRSAETIINHLNPDQFKIVPIHINPKGIWKLYDISSLSLLDTNLIFRPSESYYPLPPVLPCDVIFSVLHGRLGEDGAMQGLFEVLNIPYVGTNVLASALGMDKVIAKQLVSAHRIASVSPYISFNQAQWACNAHIYQLQIMQHLVGYPVFVKPANAGSSVGINKVHFPKDLAWAVQEAFQYDDSILIEKALIAREIELAILENPENSASPFVSVAGEVVTDYEFYSYQAKYLDDKGAKLKVPADLTHEQLKQVQSIASSIFQCLKAEGMARIDFFLEKGTGEFYFNEINTLPGFTDISMYPRLWNASGKSLPQLLQDLIHLALIRHERKSILKRSISLNNVK